MEEWREQLDRQIESDLQHKKEILLAEFDKSVKPGYEIPPFLFGGRELISRLIFDPYDRIRFFNWIVKRGYIKRDGSEYVSVSPFVEKRNGCFYVCLDMVSAFFIDTE